MREALETAPTGSVIVVDGGGSLERALWGDRLSGRAQERGILGLVVDGAVRDVDAIEELGFPVFAAGRCPTPPNRDVRGELNIPILCGGVEVKPGDHVYGDSDGVVVVSAETHAHVLDRLAST